MRFLTLLFAFFFALTTFADLPAPDLDEIPMEEAIEAAASMSLFEAVTLGIVEGLTEYIPVSSTGHLILASQALGMGDDPEYRAAVNTYLVVIQVGAILAVVSIYGSYLWKMFLGLFGRSDEGRHLLIAVIIAFIPAAVVGLLLERWIDKYLFGLWPVVFAWLVGGIALVKFGHRSKEHEDSDCLEMSDLTVHKALIIGAWQVVAMWPGTSRSLVTILGGRVAGLSLRHSVTFSFLLGVLTLTAATFYKLLGQGAEMFEALGTQNILIGIFVAWLSAWVAVKTMLAYLKRHGLEIFGFYRIALAVITTLLLLNNIISP
ncbi:MAG: undecaprenyl-diphosphate phosphatase [Verrucomicrobia bacterium]|nr:undecaprenyl-diphosphate phosphatase [Verrucomicrobiota bacterium]MCH8511111.1 undecaprenyl-diphosphate phosphatase [Kiritimatiellia bacterium]